MLSKYRNQIYGMAALGVIAVHGKTAVYNVPILRKLFEYGGAGVYLFALLSGMGLYFSMTKDKNIVGCSGSVADFYRRRFIRLIIPYGTIATLWYGIKYLLIEGDILGFVYELSTLSFWTEHKGAWYVAMLIPVYLVYPFYYKWVEKGKRGLKTAICCVFTGIVLQMILCKAPDLYLHLSAILASLIWFMLGTYIGKPIREKQFHDYLFFGGMLLIVLQKMVPVISSWKLVELFTYGATSVVAAYLLIIVFELFTLERIQNILGFLGKLSLELYLTNIFLLQAYEYFGIQDYLLGRYGVGFVSMTLPQLVVLMFGIILSMGVRTLQKCVEEIQVGGGM